MEIEHDDNYKPFGFMSCWSRPRVVTGAPLMSPRLIMQETSARLRFSFSLATRRSSCLSPGAVSVWRS